MAPFKAYKIGFNTVQLLKKKFLRIMTHFTNPLTIVIYYFFQGEITFNARGEREQHRMGLFQYRNEGIE